MNQSSKPKKNDLITPNQMHIILDQTLVPKPNPAFVKNEVDKQNNVQLADYHDLALIRQFRSQASIEHFNSQIGYEQLMGAVSESYRSVGKELKNLQFQTEMVYDSQEDLNARFNKQESLSQEILNPKKKEKKEEKRRDFFFNL